MFAYPPLQVDKPASGSHDDASVNQESPSMAGDSVKILGGEDYWPELTKAFRCQGGVDHDADVSSVVKERDNFRHYLEKEWKAISASIEQEEAKIRPSSRHSSVSFAFFFHIVHLSRLAILTPCFYTPFSSP